MKATSCPLLSKTPLGAKCCALLKRIFGKILGCGGLSVNVSRWGKCEQGFRRMAARNKPAGIRSLFYGIGKGKVRIEGLSVSAACHETVV
jgi:hypothetical protein